MQNLDEQQIDILAQESYNKFKDMVGGIHVLGWGEIPKIGQDAYREIVRMLWDKFSNQTDIPCPICDAIHELYGNTSEYTHSATREVRIG